MIECIKFKPYEKGHLLGFADLKIKNWGIEIPGFTLWEKGGRKWVNAPTVKYTDKDGQEKQKSFFYFSEKAHWAEFVRQAKVAIEKYCQENQESVQPKIETPSFDEVPF